MAPLRLPAIRPEQGRASSPAIDSASTMKQSTP